jgi:DNA repair protein RadC
MKYSPHYSLVGYVMEAKPAPRTRIKVTGPDDLIGILSPYKKAEQEHFGIVFLNGRHEYIGHKIVHIGGLNSCIVDKRSVFRAALLRRGTVALVLFHNHPSGDPEPSQEDIDMTAGLIKAGDILSVNVLDHIVVATRGFISLRSRNLM